MILVSACLLGWDIRYDGGNSANSLLLKYKDLNKYIPICPEDLGGLPTPRFPAEIVKGTGSEVLAGEAAILDAHGNEVTEEFRKGARALGDLLAKKQITAAILKEGSPSCGVHRIYDGTFTGQKRAGTGVAAAFLHQMRVKIYSEEDLTEDLLQELLAAKHF